MTPALVMLITIAVLNLALVVLQILLHGRMPSDRRRLIERGMIWGLCPVLVVLWASRAAMAWMDADVGGALLGIVVALAIGWLGLGLLNKPVRADGTRT